MPSNCATSSPCKELPIKVTMHSLSRQCTGMSKVAYDLLTAEDSAEWACDDCISRKTIPRVKMVSKT